MQAPPGPSGASESNACTEANDSKVGPKARILDSLNALDSDPGPNLLDRVNRKSAPRPRLLDGLDALESGPWSESNGANASKVGSQGQDFRKQSMH